VPLTDLSPSPSFVKVAEASRAWARHASTADTFEAAFAEALDHVAGKRGLAFIEVAIAKS
jgi:acetolactate synthase I/II/III large subunit